MGEESFLHPIEHGTEYIHWKWNVHFEYKRKIERNKNMNKPFARVIAVFSFPFSLCVLPFHKRPRSSVANPF